MTQSSSAEILRACLASSQTRATSYTGRTREGRRVQVNGALCDCVSSRLCSLRLNTFADMHLNRHAQVYSQTEGEDSRPVPMELKRVTPCSPCDRRQSPQSLAATKISHILRKSLSPTGRKKKQKTTHPAPHRHPQTPPVLPSFFGQKKGSEKQTDGFDFVMPSGDSQPGCG